ncbi:hypothetical protein [Clostridium felsineum]|uniref:Uncharacterized protein n=1 Tax=Clostridium felsineum TaxID=36839 RepID=A0A1S8KXE9_9CLOT|nr:hypothetical protein [Clostridium felsineum]MCR3761188.1 transcriptional regulator [Clostridium felsineum]URZ04615.1 hypothetical protein CLAUR_047040 [Clostridium felsineum]URZ09136.1 hypothetical protein CLROS_045520 [Clostridium felsineum]URZ13823.1 hypothetical protein CROST_046010 [Clostridium felsineum]URZ18645.1 hypothetical protein CLFE_047330 [Clostridium felsineum DSM 794]
MSTYEIISVGTKLKNLRRKYRLNQDDLAGNEITRNLISQIEHGKARLTKHAAEIMFKNLKEICSEKNIEIDENIEYLLEDEQSQANKILEKYIEELKVLSVYKDDSFNNKLAEIENFLIKWNLNDKKTYIFELAGDYFVSISDYYKSSLYYEKARALIDMYSKDSIGLFRKLSMVYFYMGNFNQNVKCCEFVLNWFTDISDEYRCIFLFNSALCYTELKDYERAIENFTKIEPMLKDTNKSKYCDILLQKAICFHCLGDYKKSLEINSKLLELLNDDVSEQRILVLINMSETYQKLNDAKKVEEYLNIIRTNVNKISSTSKHLSTIYFDMGKQYKWLKDSTNAEKYCLQSLEIAKKYTHQFLISDIILELIDIYFEDGNAEKITEMKNEFFILSAQENKMNPKILVKLVYCYAKLQDLHSIEDVYSYSHKFN